MELLEPLVLGASTAPSRVMFGPHATNLGWGRTFSPRHVAYYERRAAGGAGLIVTETASIHDSDWPYERSPDAARAAVGWSAIVDACRPHGALVVAGLGHAGSQGSSAYSQRELWAPSRVASVNTREVPKSMEPADIDSVVAGFVAAARTAVEAGCDGVEINAGQYSLLREFLSGLNNQRDDQWGLDRGAFTERVLREVRGAVGDGGLVSLRLSCDELAPWAGITPEHGAELAVRFAPLVDVLVVVRGSMYAVAETRPDSHHEPGFNLGLAADVRTAVRAAHGDSSPAVFAQGSIVDWGQAEWAVGEGDRCDGVEMTRAQIADAELVAKLRAATPRSVRPCILCNQTCRVRDGRNPIVTCVVDPSAGHELDEPEPGGTTDEPKVLTVIGGGPAGLEAARVAAERGHTVTLHERTDRLGGALTTAARASGRERLGAIVEWLESECRRLGVGVELGSGLDAADVDGPAILATGAHDEPPSFAVTRAAVVRSATEVLDGVDLPPGAVLVWDPIGGPIAVSVAETLAAQGREVHFATPDNIVATMLSRTLDLSPANVRLHRAGVTLHKRVTLSSVKKGAVTLADRFGNGTYQVQAAAVVSCGHRIPTAGVEFESAERGTALLRVGDAVAGRTLGEAILEARRAVVALDGGTWISDGVPMGTVAAGGVPNA